VDDPAGDHPRESELLLRIRLALLLALILFSASITPKRLEVPFPTAARASLAPAAQC
jgi:hypothetical protein